MNTILRKLRRPRRDNAKPQVSKYTRSKFGNAVFFLILIGGGVFSVIPLIYCTVTAFKPLDELLVFPPSLFWINRPTIQNFTALPDLLSSLSTPLSRYIFNSLFISVSGTGLHVLVAAMAAFGLSKTDLKYKNTIFTIIQFSLLFNAYTLGVPRYLILSGIQAIDTFFAYLLPVIPSAMGVFLMKQYIDGFVPDILIEAAKIDGAGWLRTFWSIVFPTVRPCVLTLTLFSFRDIWAIVPQGTIFNESLKTLPTVMSTIMSGGIARQGAGMAATVIMMIPPIIVYLISQSSIRETMSNAGIKG